QAAIILFGCKFTARNLHTLAEMGVLGFICKYDELKETLVPAIRRANRGQVYLSSEAALIRSDPNPAQALSLRLLNVLQWIEQGKTVQDIAQVLQLSERSVYSARKRLHEIFGVQTDAQLISKAFRCGVLAID
ncbi:MAG: LuxR C-terminal-related transcriptional regulator, partial [Anaerolineae bacterium]|nr:LuxR C-terminal-related transcriptional regulator [Anaerolineae bacterium]